MKKKTFTFMWCISLGLWIAVWAADFRGAESSAYVKFVKTTSDLSDQSAGLSKIDDTCINVNTSDKQGLILLPGVGPVLAERILKFRKENGPFQCTEDIDKVKGVGAGKLEGIRSRVCF